MGAHPGVEGIDLLRKREVIVFQVNDPIRIQTWYVFCIFFKNQIGYIGSNKNHK